MRKPAAKERSVWAFLDNVTIRNMPRLIELDRRNVMPGHWVFYVLDLVRTPNDPGHSLRLKTHGKRLKGELEDVP